MRYRGDKVADGTCTTLVQFTLSQPEIYRTSGERSIYDSVTVRLSALRISQIKFHRPYFFVLNAAFWNLDFAST